jgi:hypothetical protein
LNNIGIEYGGGKIVLLSFTQNAPNARRRILKVNSQDDMMDEFDFTPDRKSADDGQLH